jgi:AraC family transcriptional regulator
MGRNSYRVRFDGRALADKEIARIHTMEREVGNFFLTEANYPPNLTVPSHAHENPSFYLVLAGCIAERHGRLARECLASTLVFTPPGETHSNITSGAGCRCFMIDLKPNWLKSLSTPSLNLYEWADFDGGAPVWLAQRAFREACNLDALSPMVIEGIALELLAEMSRSKTRLDAKCPQWLEQIRELLHAHFAQRLTISELANAVNRHPVHVATQFRRIFHCTIGDYLRHLRIEAACRQIANSDHLLIQIALDCGFADQGHFSRVFKALLGITPSRYRRNLGGLKQRQIASFDPSN